MQYLINGISAGMTYALIAAGLALVFEVAGFFNLAHGAVYAIGAYVAYFVGISLGWGPCGGIPLALLLSALVGALMLICIYRPLERAGGGPMGLLLSSLGMVVVVQNLLAMGFGDDTKRLSAASVSVGCVILGARVTPVQLCGVAITLSSFLALWLFLRFSVTGVRMRAVSSNRQLASAVGIAPEPILLQAFVLGSILAGVAGIVTGYDTSLTPMMALNGIFMAVVVVILAGGKVLRTLAAGVCVGLCQNLAVWALPNEWQDATVFAVLILALMFRPQSFRRLLSTH